MTSYQVLEKLPTRSLTGGIKAGVPIAIGYIPIALTFGLIARTAGLTFMDTIGMSLFVFAGAAQLMSLQMIMAGVGGIEIVLATFIINIRHFLMTASLNDRIDDSNLFKRGLIAFGITDETFSVASLQKGKLSPVFLCGLILMAYGSWVLSSGLGFVVGASLPIVLKEGMKIALYAMFIGLVVPSMRKNRKVVLLFGFAAILSTIFSLFLSSGWAIVAATLLASVSVEVYGLLKNKKKKEDRKSLKEGEGV